MRVLICMDCETMEQLPDYTGPLELAEVPGPDGNLQERKVPPVGADAHLDYIAEPHRRKEHKGQLIHVPDEDWDNETTRAEILAQVRSALAGGTTGLTPEAYALKDTFQEDAMRCFNAHKRPKAGCIDWHDKSKRLGNSLLDHEERKLAKQHGLKAPKQFLCDFCPVASHVEHKKVEKKGLYK